MWHLPNAACLAAFVCGGPQWERAVRKLCWLPAAGSASTGEDSGDSRDAGVAPLLVACCEDGSMQFWRVQLPTTLSGQPAEAEPAAEPAGADSTAGAEDVAAGSDDQPAPAAACTLVARLAATHRRQDCITAVCAATSADGALQLWTGDSSGHVALWDVSPLLPSAPAAPTSSDAAKPAGLGTMPRRQLLWRAAGAAVVSLDALAPRRGLLLVGAQDASVAVWTQGGGLVGRFGRDAWDLEAPASWRDPQAAARPPPLPEDDGAGSGLTPREVIAATPRRCSWAVCGRDGGGSRSARGSALPSARGGPGTAVAASAGQPSNAEPALDSLADTLASISRLRPPRCAEDGPAPAGGAAAAAAAAAAEAPAGATDSQPHTQQATGAPACAAGAAAAPGPHPQLPRDSAGARLAAMAAQAAAAKAGRWDIPVHVQAHSALAVQPLDAVLGALPGGCCGAGHGGAGCRWAKPGRPTTSQNGARLLGSSAACTAADAPSPTRAPAQARRGQRLRARRARGPPAPRQPAGGAAAWGRWAAAAWQRCWGAGPAARWRASSKGLGAVPRLPA